MIKLLMAMFVREREVSMFTTGKKQKIKIKWQEEKGRLTDVNGFLVRETKKSFKLLLSITWPVTVPPPPVL